MNSCLQGNGCLWVLIILLILGSNGNVFSSSIFAGCGLPVIVALGYCLYKNGTLGAIFGHNDGCGCGCNN